MKNLILLLSSTLLTISSLMGQSSTDIVSAGPGYANQVWYSLANGTQAEQPKNNWDIAFDLATYGTAIRLNSSGGAQLWVYPGSLEDFASLDTTGFHSWNQVYNSATSWTEGAFSQNQSGFDVGWGIYNPMTHITTGDSLFVIQLTSGEYRKLWIEQLAGDTYTFRQATFDNSIDQTHTLSKSDFTGKNFGYFDLQAQTSLDREPFSSDWDLVFGQYTAFIPIPYLVSGIQHNYNTQVAKAYPVDSPENYTDYSAHTFHSEINTIGYNWKNYSGSWTVADSLVYFIKTQTEDIWKVVFTGFGGSANGEFEFTKELLITSSVDDNQNNFGVKIYPNPASTRVNLIIDRKGNQPNTLSITSVTGRVVWSQQITESGLIVKLIDTSHLPSGVYFVTLNDGKSQQTQKLIKR